MGGRGSGGRRPGSGRKPKDAAAHDIHGTKSQARRPPAAAKVLAHPSAPQVPPAPPLPTLDEADAPNDLVFEERRVWLELAPHAIANGTLTKASDLAFRLLCKNVVLLNQFYASVVERGTADHRGMIQRVDAGLLRFELSPCGKAMVGVGAAGSAAAAPPVNPVERFIKKR